MSNEVTIENVGPVERIAVPAPEGGGVVVFRGRNGSGKTMSLDAINSAVTGQGKVPVRDGQLKATVDAHGVKLTIGRSTRRKGEAEVQSLEGKLSIADLVEPPIKDPERADAHRIRALVSLVAAEPDILLFADLIGGDPTELLSPETFNSEDLVTMTARVKRDLEAEARKAEDRAANYRKEAEIQQAAAGEGDPKDARPECEVNHEVEKAIEALAALKSQATASAKAVQAATEARQSIEAAQASYTGPTAEEAVAAHVASADAVNAAEKALAEAMAEMRRLGEQRVAAERHEAMLAGWKDSVALCENVQAVDQGEIEAAQAAVDTARKAAERAAAGRRAASRQDMIDAALIACSEQTEKAEQLREAARGTEEILSSVIAKAGVPLRVEPVAQQMRLVTDTVARGRTCFGELSPGERWRMALEIAAKALGSGGFLAVPQHAFEQLDPQNRAFVAGMARELGLVVYTALADDGELRAEVYDA